MSNRMRSFILILWSILLSLITARYYHRLRHIRLESSFCSGYQELKDNKCSARLSSCSELKPNELTTMRQVFCGFKYDPAVQTDPPPPQPNNGGFHYIHNFHGIHGIPGGPGFSIHGGHGYGIHGDHGYDIHGGHGYGSQGGIHPKLFADVFEADIHQYRFMASIYSSDRKFLCGGALVSPKTVITSAQCMSQMRKKRRKRDDKQKKDKPQDKEKQKKGKQEEETEEQTPEEDPSPASPGNLIVRFGEQYLNINPVFHKIYEYDVENIEIHESYDPNTHQNDIAILRLVNAVPICLFPPILIPRKFEYWLDYDHIAGCSATYMGWGLINQRPYFRAQTGQVLPQYFCQKLFNWETDQLHRSQLCVDSPSGVCITDTGGPLITHNKHGWVLIGILTFGKHCRTPGLPLVFSRITEAIDRIFKYIDQDFNSRNVTDIYHHECHHIHGSHHLAHHKFYAYQHSHEKHGDIHPIHDKGVVGPFDKHVVYPIDVKEDFNHFEKHYSVHSYDDKDIHPNVIHIQKHDTIPEIVVHGSNHPISVKDVFDSSYKSHGSPHLGGVLPIKHINFEHLK